MGTRRGCLAFGLLDGDANDFAMLCHIHGRRFTCGTYHADAVSAFGDVPFDQFSQAGVVYRAVLQHGGNEGGNAASNGLKSFRHGV